jgi:hypothetical protein
VTVGYGDGEKKERKCFYLAFQHDTNKRMDRHIKLTTTTQILNILKSSNYDSMNVLRAKT